MKCNTCANENYCYDDNHQLVRDGCADNGFAAYVPQTHADRIRQMTDEELADWILREPTIGYFAVCPPGTKDGEDCPTSPCEQCWLDWLKSPVEVDNG